MYDQSQKIGRPNNSKGINRISTMGYVHLCLGRKIFVLIIITLFKNCKF
jgi:hypothetical protein